MVDQYTILSDVYEEGSEEPETTVKVLYTELLTHMTVYGSLGRGQREPNFAFSDHFLKIEMNF